MSRPAARRMRDIAPFHVMELMTQAKALEAQGCDIVHMEVGEPDFPTPEPILAAARAFLRHGEVHYTAALGLPALREAIAGFYRSRYGQDVAAEQIVVTTGASGALILALACLTEPGRRWLLPDPGYPCNRHFVRMFEGIPTALPVFPADNYQPTPAQLEAAWADDIDGLIVASPANPTGTLLSPAQLAGLARFTAARDAHLIVDEIYHGLTYETDADTVLAHSRDAWVVQSFSKYFQMTGWRLGWLVVPKPHLRDVEKLAQNLYISPPTPAQHAALAAFHPETLAILEERRQAFRQRRDFLAPELERLGLRIAAPSQGAFYLYCDSSALGADSFQLAGDILRQAHVALTPGIDFGANQPERHLRIAYTTDLSRLEEAIRRLGRYFGR